MFTLFIDGRSFTADNVPRYCRKHILKSNENIFKPKCNKALRKKLKKYKLRRDGQEDPDIINVSQTLITSLRIKSPNNQHSSHIGVEPGENRPYNYLTKMVRLKKTAAEPMPIATDLLNQNNEIENEIISLTSTKEQDKKQMDAFKLLMDSRNKSIGSNSPGKDRCEGECQLQTKNEEKELKAKRIIMLNKMAQAKGSLKTLEIEEYREENIKRKMEDRAIRLKDMVLDVKKKNGKKSKTKPIAKLELQPVTTIRQDNNHRKDTLNNESVKLNSFDLFKDLQQSPPKNIEKLSKEDEEFLKKLSPSIRKKENMLCYFQKVNKDLMDSGTSLNDMETDFQDTNNFIIKVKLSSKTKVKKKKNNSNLVINLPVDKETNKNLSNGMVPNCNNHTTQYDAGKEMISENEDRLMLLNDDGRPKRHSKRPVKYTDDFQLMSSDEDLHIFTPKKKRKGKSVAHCTLKEIKDDNHESTKSKHSKTNRKEKGTLQQTKEKVIKRYCKKNKEVKSIQPKTETKQCAALIKATKLAPIFVTKLQLDRGTLEAKQKFLHSGTPSQLRKNAIQQSNILTAPDEFQTVVHIQNLAYINTPKVINTFALIDMNYSEDVELNHEDNLFNQLLDLTILKEHCMPQFNNNVGQILKDIKTSYPKFPVYRTYHLLKEKSKGDFKDCIYPDLDNSVEIFNNMVEINNVNPDKLNWVDKYKPTVKRQVIGNFEGVKELKSWLVSWTETNEKSKMNKSDGSDSSDFYQSDADSRGTIKNSNNLLIITGAVGSGKTLSVYAVAAELAIKVIEVNASTKRTGKIMLQDLQEATQSHKVDRGKSCVESQKSYETNNYNEGSKAIKKQGRKKKGNGNCDILVTTNKASRGMTVSQENRTVMSLILIDDADIVFDQDDGFCSAISQLIQTSKRPVILVTSSLTCPHLQKFLNQAQIIKMRPFLPRMLGTWLDIMCLVDSNMCSPGLGAKTLELFKGDIRKTINYLQFYITSHKYLCDMVDLETSQGEEVLKLNTDDENSCMSWLETEGRCEKTIIVSNADNIISKYYVKKQLQLLQTLSSLNTFSIWWNLPDILNYSTNNRNEKPIGKLNKNTKCRDIKKLNVIAGMLNTMSITDLLDRTGSNGVINTTLRPWYSCEYASVLDNEDFACYNRSNECLHDMVSELTTTAVSQVQRVLKSDNKTEIHYPSMSLHRDRERVVSRHRALADCSSPSCALDRRALALDYWALCRSICRTEKVKTSTSSKRNNRYCHYLKSLNVLCKNEYFDDLAESFT